LREWFPAIEGIFIVIHTHPAGVDESIEDPDLLEGQRTAPRTIAPEQWERFESNIGEIFQAFGLNLGTPGTELTPKRFLRALFDATEGYEGDPKLITAFPTECHGSPDCDLSQVIEGPIPYHALCEHHAFPFFGQAYVGYIAHENIIGISKLTRMVRLFAKRFTVQERMGTEIADVLSNTLGAHGVAIYVTGAHLCTQMRGVREREAVTRTTTWRGVYGEDASLRREFLDICTRSGAAGR
jgi:GTP cyclohydrolase I